MATPEEISKINFIPMCDSYRVCSAYENETVKLDNDAMTELELVFKIQDLLDDYGYSLGTAMEDGLPVLELTKQS